MRENCVDASLLHRWIENKLGFAIFMSDRVVMFDGDAAKGLAISRHAISKDAIIGDVGDQQEDDQSQQQAPDKRSPDERSLSFYGQGGSGLGGGFIAIDFIAMDDSHGLNYTRTRFEPKLEVLTILHKKIDPILLSRTSKHGGI